MTEADPKYFPRPKGKKKVSKTKRTAPAPTFPTPVKRPELQKPNKGASFGNKVWAN